MKHLILIIAMLFSVTAFAQQTLDNEFTQVKVMKVSGKSTTKQGHIIFDGKDHLSMIYSEPEGEYFIIEGNMVKMNMDGKKSDIDTNSDNEGNNKLKKMVALQRATLLNCLSGNWEQVAIDHNAETSITEKDGMKTVSLVVNGKPKGGYKSVELTYRLSDGMMTKMVMEEIVGTINTYEVK